MNYLSPKQSVRHQSSSETMQELACNIRTDFAFMLWKLTRIFSKSISTKGEANYLNALSILKAKFSEDEYKLSIREKQVLDRLFLLASRNKNYLDKFDFPVAFSNDSQLKKQHKILKDLFVTCNTTFYYYFKNKLQKLTEIRNIDEVDPLKEEEKLTVNDINILEMIPKAKKLLENLKKDRVKEIGDIDSKLIELESLSTTPFFENLKLLCEQSCSQDMIFLGDYHTFRAFNGPNFDFIRTLHRLFMGRFFHIGMFVNPKGKGLHLSHVNFITSNHALMHIKHPLALPFNFSLSLDIKPLIPSNLSEKQQEKIIEIFFAEFQRLAEEEHPEIPLAETKQHLRMLIMGHKTIFPQNLDKVSYPPKNTPTMCSSYVGITFLKAVQKMNQYLQEQGIQAQIAHPFGTHENLMNMDILRLIYLWKQLKVIKSQPINKTLAKVISSTSFLNF